MTPEQSRRAIFLSEVGIGNVWVRRHVPASAPETVPAELPALEAVTEIRAANSAGKGITGAGHGCH